MKKQLMFCMALLYSCLGFAHVQQDWQEFLIALQGTAQQQNTQHAHDVAVFKTLLSDLNILQALPLWKSTVFYQKMRSNPMTTMPAQEKQNFSCALVQELAQSYTRQAQKFMQELITYKKSLATINAKRTLSCTNSKAAQQLWRQIQTELVTPLSSNQFINSFHAAPWISKLIACDIMRDCINTIDTTIKTVKSNNTIGFDDRVQQFKVMIDDFNTLFKTWAQSIMPESALTYNYDWPLQIYLRHMQEHHEMITTGYGNYSFHRSIYFSVNAAMLGSGTNFARHYPATAEDIFMLLHQNSLAVVGATYNSIFAQDNLEECIDLPELFKTAVTYFQNRSFNCTDGSVYHANRIGLTYTPDIIEFCYNVPLNNHSSTFQLCYNQITQQCTMSMQFIGEARDRWEQIAFLAGISQDLSNIELANDIVFDQQAGIVSWSWVIKNSADLQRIDQYIPPMIVLAYSSNLTKNMMRPLARGSQSFDESLQQASDNYKNKYGTPNQAWLLSLANKAIEEDEAVYAQLAQTTSPYAPAINQQSQQSPSTTHRFLKKGAIGLVAAALGGMVTSGLLVDANNQGHSTEDAAPLAVVAGACYAAIAYWLIDQTIST